ncbi:MAG: hypothetical protein K6G81_03635 [Lachnospiraceae bacterium]|nr:hypothetical protein [Lachnospiraceae bacterium]
MTFLHEPEEYAKNLGEYDELNEAEFSPEESKEEIIARLRDISAKKKKIADIQNEIIREYIERFEDGEVTLDEEAADKLYKFIESLTVQERFVMDTAVAIRVCRLLYKYYHDVGNREKALYAANRGGVCEMQRSAELEEHDFFEFPRLIEEYFPIIDELDQKSKWALLVTYSYRIMIKTDEGLNSLPELFPKVENLIISNLDKVEDKGKAKILKFQLYTNFLAELGMMLRQDEGSRKHHKPLLHDVDIEKNRELIERCLTAIEGSFEELPINPLQTNAIRINIETMRYHLGQISFEELLRRYETVAADDLRADGGGTACLFAYAMYLNYLYNCSPYTPEEDERRAQEKISEYMPHVLEMKKQKQFQFAYGILVFLNSTSLFGDFLEFYDTVLAFTVYADKALYVHTVMVKEISRLLLTRILEEKPEMMNGVCGWSTDYILNHKEEVIELLEQCAMCHDIGKHYLLEIVSNSSRRLTDEEFSIIKTHPGNFDIVCEKDHMESPRLKCVRDCALLHHRWHNGQGGYPELPQTENRPFVDILSIADSLDAATDSIGRPYGKGKTLDDLSKEFLDMGGTRYSREVAEILVEPEIKAAVQEIITTRREEVNYKIYAFNEY